MKKMLYRVATLISVLVIIFSFTPSNVFAQFPAAGGAYTIDTTLANTFVANATSGNFKSFHRAISALNATAASTIASPVTFNVASGELFYEPAFPLIITYVNDNFNAPLITFQTSGGKNPVLSSQTSGSATSTQTEFIVNEVTYAVVMAGGSAFIELSGTDNITFNGINLNEAYTGGSHALQMAFGYLLVRASATDGCQNVTIENCNINFYNNNIVFNTVGILQNNVDTTFTATNPTSVSGEHSGNKFYNDTINNATDGIIVTGYAAVSPFTIYDQNNEIGGNEEGTGNTVTNFGGAPQSNSWLFGIIAAYQRNFVVARNSVNNGINSSPGIGIPIIGMDVSTGIDVSIYKNKVYAISMPGGGDCSNCDYVYGMVCRPRTASTGPYYLYNNFIGDLSAPNVSWQGFPSIFGLTIGAAGGVSDTVGVYYNTVYLNNIAANASGSSSTTVGLSLGGSCVKDIRNNLIVNTSVPGSNASAPGFSIAINNYDTGFSFISTAANNLYYAGTPGPLNLIFNAGYNGGTGAIPNSPPDTAQSMATYHALAGATIEKNSVSQLPVWVNNTIPADTDYLFLKDTTQLAVGGGLPITSPISITDDWLGNIRSSISPCIGADEVTNCNISVGISPAPPTICNGASVTLTTSGASTYQWSPATGLSATTGDSVIANPTITTTYTVIGVTGSCTTTVTYVVTVNPSPNIPTITVSVTGDTLISSATTDNQWNFEDKPLNGATDSILVIKGLSKGWYSVTVTNDANGCSTTSDSVYVNPTGINTVSLINDEFSVYPNPFYNSIFIKINSSVANVNEWSLLLTNVLGQTVYNKPSLNYSNELDLSNLPGGVYFITVINKSDRSVFPVVKQN